MLVYSGERNHVHIILLLFMSGLLTLMVLIKSVMKVPKYFVLGSQNRSLGYSQLLGLVLRWRTLPEIPSDG